MGLDPFRWGRCLLHVENHYQRMQKHVESSVKMGRHKVMRRAVRAALLVLVGISAVFVESVGASGSQAPLNAKALSISDLPSGWSVGNSHHAINLSSVGGCLGGLTPDKRPVGFAQVVVRFDLHSLPTLEEVLEQGRGAETRYAAFVQILSRCHTLRTTKDGKKVTGSVDIMTFPALAESSSAYSIYLSATGVAIGIDVVCFRLGSIDGVVAYESFSPDEGTVQAFVDEAIHKVEGSPVLAPSTMS
jgi:hypothetical protein